MVTDAVDLFGEKDIQTIKYISVSGLRNNHGTYQSPRHDRVAGARLWAEQKLDSFSNEEKRTVTMLSGGMGRWMRERLDARGEVYQPHRSALATYRNRDY